MSLRVKSLLAATTTIVALVLILALLARAILHGSYARLEERDTRAHVERALNALTDDLASLDRTTGDYSGWDDTYAFMRDHRQAYLTSNYPDITFSHNKLDLVLLIDVSGRVVFGRAFDLEAQRAVPVPERLLALARTPKWWRHASLESSLVGIVALPEGPMLIASRPILTSMDAGPSRGAMIMGRRLSASEVARLADMTRLLLDVWPLDGQASPPDVDEARAHLSRSDSILVRPVSATTVCGYALVEGLDGQPAFVLRVTRDREVYRQGQQTLSYLIGSLLVTSIVIGTLFVLFLERLVLARLARLNAEVGRIGTSGDVRLRLSAFGSDELGSLSGAINGTLDSLERSRGLLRQREQQGLTLLDSLPAWAYLKDAQGAFVTANQQFCQAVGCTRESIVGKTDRDFFSAQRAELYAADDLRVLTAGETVETSEDAVWRGEQPIVLATRKVPVKDEAGQVVGLIGLAFDVSERKRVAQELALARDQALEALHFRAQLLAHVSERLRAPITAVCRDVEALRAGAHGTLASEPQAALGQVILSCQKLLRHTNDLVDLARIEAGKVVLAVAPFSPVALIDSVLSIAGLLARDRHLELSGAVALDVPPALDGDVQRLRQILLSLVDNAIRFTREGTIHVRIHQSDEAHYALEVSDTGAGIAMEEQAAMRAALALGGVEAQLPHPSLGLGLSIVRQLATLMGGVVSLQSEIGRGTTFTVTLPILAASADARSKG
jgi:PAS domain S-box-containing protein